MSTTPKRSQRVKYRPVRSVFEKPKGGAYLSVEWNGLSGTAFYVRAEDRAHADAMFAALIECPDVAGVSLFVGGRFKGARDGAGS